MKPAQWERATAPTLADIEVLAAAAWERLPQEFRAKAADVLIRVEDYATDEVLEFARHPKPIRSSRPLPRRQPRS